jgi:hypothetical protein
MPRGSESDVSAKVTLDGFEALVRHITDSPQVIRDEGMGIVSEESTGAETEIAGKYPVRAYGRNADRGTLRGRVRTEFPSSSILVAVVRSTAPHSHLYEFGTRDRYTGARNWRTSKGERRSKSTGKRWAFRGKSPEHPVTVPIARARRSRMTRRLAEMVRRQGYEVTGA